MDNVYVHCQLGVFFKPYKEDLTWNIRTRPFTSTPALQNLAMTSTSVVVVLTEAHAMTGSYTHTKDV